MVAWLSPNISRCAVPANAKAGVPTAAASKGTSPNPSTIEG